MNDRPEDPADALAEIRRAQTVAHDRIGPGSWPYDLIYAGLAAMAVGAQALPLPLNVLGSTLGAMGFGLLARGWANRYGVSVSWLSPRRARWVTYGLGVVILAMMLVGVALGRTGHRWLALPLGLAAGLAALLASRLWARVYRAETGTRS